MNICFDGRPENEAYELLKDRLNGITKELFICIYKDWDLLKIQDNDQCVGVVFVKGNEIHIAINEDKRKNWASKRLIRQILGLAKTPMTKVFKNDGFRKEFAERLGFVKIKEDELFDIYEVKHARF